MNEWRRVNWADVSGLFQSPYFVAVGEAARGISPFIPSAKDSGS